MFQLLTFYHSIFRWLVLLALSAAIFRAYKGYTSNKVFTKTDERLRHWTATILHIQLLLGMSLYLQSPLMNYFWKHPAESLQHMDILFFSLIHPLLMLIAIIVVTIGSSLAKRRSPDLEKFRTILIWFAVALLLILIAIPWPFSPLSSRPYLRL